MKKAVVTGYKPGEMGIFKSNDPKVPLVKETIKRKLVPLIEEGLEWVILSGQMGVELWAAEVVLDLKEEYSIHLAVIPPFENQQERWPEDLQMLYEEVTIMADFFQPIYNKGYEGPHQFRAKDQFLVEHSDGCLVLFDEETKGSPEFFLRVAKQYESQSAYMLTYITPMDLDETVEDLRMSDPDYWRQ